MTNAKQQHTPTAEEWAEAQRDLVHRLKKIGEQHDTIQTLKSQNAELLEALSELLGKLEIMGGCNEFDMDEDSGYPEFTSARAAIAKATGGQS